MQPSCYVLFWNIPTTLCLSVYFSKSLFTKSAYANNTFWMVCEKRCIYRLTTSGCGHSSFLITSKHWLSCVNTSVTEHENNTCSDAFWNWNIWIQIVEVGKRKFTLKKKIELNTNAYNLIPEKKLLYNCFMSVFNSVWCLGIENTKCFKKHFYAKISVNSFYICMVCI